MVKKIGIQDQFSDAVVNEVLSFDATEAASEISEEIVGAARDLLARAAGTKEYTGRFEAELLSGRIFFLALGSLATAATASPYTISPSSTLPIFTVKSTDEYGNDESYHFCRVESIRFAFEVGEDVTYECSWRGRSIGTSAPTGTPSNVTPLVYSDGQIDFNGVIGRVQSCEIEINNDLTDIFQIGDQDAIDIHVGHLGTSGRMTVLGKSLSVGDTGGMTLTLASATGDRTITWAIKNIEVMEKGVRISTDPTEYEYPFTAKGVSGFDIMKVASNTGNSIGADLY